MSMPAYYGTRFVRLPKEKGEKVGGLSRASLYELQKKHPKLFRKYGAATLLDLDVLNEISASFPVAEPGTEEEDAA